MIIINVDIEWLIEYLLSFGTQEDIIEPAYLGGIMAERAKKIYENIKLDIGCQHMCDIICLY